MVKFSCMVFYLFGLTVKYLGGNYFTSRRWLLNWALLGTLKAAMSLQLFYAPLFCVPFCAIQFPTMFLILDPIITGALHLIVWTLYMNYTINQRLNEMIYDRMNCMYNSLNTGLVFRSSLYLFFFVFLCLCFRWRQFKWRNVDWLKRDASLSSTDMSVRCIDKQWCLSNRFFRCRNVFHNFNDFGDVINFCDGIDFYVTSLIFDDLKYFSGRQYRNFKFNSIIVFIWSQHDGGNVDKEHWLRFPPKPYDAKS